MSEVRVQSQVVERQRDEVHAKPSSPLLASRDPLLRRMLAVADASAATLAVVSLAVLGGGIAAAAWASLIIPLWIVLAKFHGLYDRDHRALRHVTSDELSHICAWASSGTAVTTGILLVIPTIAPTLGTVVGAWVVAAASGALLRAIARATWRATTAPERTLVLGAGAVAAAARRKLELFPETHATVVRMLDVVDVEELHAVDAFRDIDRVIVAADSVDEALLAQLVAIGRRDRIKVSVVPPMRGMFGTAVQLKHIAEMPIVEYNTWDASRSTLLLKRVLDVVGASMMLVVLSPVLVAVAVAITAESRGPLLFSQIRAGVGGRPFRMYKFRTMVHDAEARLDEVVRLDDLRDPMFKLTNDPRVTRAGRVLRRWSLDELPQLVNVLRGEMSLVGPRPEQVELVRRYRPEHRFRLQVKPGLTGPMQVFGRGQLTFDERLAVEREYIENVTLARDLRILALTIAAVFGGRGAY